MSEFTIAAVTATDDRWGHMNGWGGGWMWLWGIAVMAAFVVLIVWLVRSTTGGAAEAPRPTASSDRAREILSERYARGEVSTEEYWERVEQLR